MLLSSLNAFWDLLRPLCDHAGSIRFCEIGVSRGEFAEVLVNYCLKRSCWYCGVDTELDDHFVSGHSGPQSIFHQEASLDVLADLPPQDVYFIDGDHNYYTVSNELRLILRHEGNWPLIFLHDVCWPWGRRDQYCAPESIPVEFRHRYSTVLGVLPGRNELGPGGFSGDSSDYSYGAADHEGGPRNGVLTAVEDVLCELPKNEWKVIVIPVVFGLGIMYSPPQCRPEVSEHLALLSRSVDALRHILELLERDRLDLFFGHLQSVKDLATIHAEYGKLQQAYGGLENHSKQLLTSYNDLMQVYHQLETHDASLQTAYDELSLRHQKRKK